MRAWEAVPVPSPASIGLGSAPELALFDTRRGRVEVVDPGEEASLYVCGITPYDATHMGHAATYVGFDLAVRAWLQAGHRVRYVQNVTDVDDPLLERAMCTGQDWVALAERETELFREDMTALAVLPPDVYLGAVEAIPLILELIDLLVQRGAVYDVQGDLYFSVAHDDEFGAVSGLDRNAMLAVFGERGGDPDRPGKRDRLDCLLWQLQRPGEPGWPSAYGAGRPGWHIECAAIALAHLGRTFDVQGGGSDLAFPHHEMSASEIQVAFEGEPFAQHYVHAGMVGFEGHKMSKSRGNLVLVSKVRADGVDPRVIRLALLAHHYRTDWEWTDDVLEEAQARLADWSAALGRGGPDATETVDVVRARLAADLDAPGALAAVDAWVRSEASAVEGAGERLANVIEASLGVRL